MSTYIWKGQRKLSAFYQGDLPYSIKLDIVKDQRGLQEVKIFTPYKNFAFRRNDWYCFENEQRAAEFLQHCRDEVTNDDRFCDDHKTRLIRFINSLQISE